ncbi:hypothetical protein [Sphingomonas sp. GC_Shp_3]|uniref:hypothetical protein n=1 Tax=Sphingomonas sp. GC_Shp_3 TaxID=2937383 RepID=UPI00226A90D7
MYSRSVDHTPAEVKAMASCPVPDKNDYLYRRAEQELEQAQRAAHPAAVKAHYVLAGYYLDQVYGGGEQPADGKGFD